MSQVYPETSGNPNFPGGPPKYSTGIPQNQYYGMPPPPPPPAYNAPQPQQGWSYPQPYPGTPFAQPQATALHPVQNQVVILDGSGGQPIYYRATESYAGPIVLSCFVLWCFNFLFGLIAFILAGK
jgi:hypothetical protein